MDTGNKNDYHCDFLNRKKKDTDREFLHRNRIYRFLIIKKQFE